jgi:hypothetical protein
MALWGQAQKYKNEYNKYPQRERRKENIRKS